MKVTPGSDKCGKACKQAVHVFSTQPNLVPREAALIKALNDNELHMAMPGNVKVSAPSGLDKAKNARKKHTIKHDNKRPLN